MEWLIQEVATGELQQDGEQTQVWEIHPEEEVGGAWKQDLQWLWARSGFLD